MRPFAVSRIDSMSRAVAEKRNRSEAHFLCGGTTQLDLMKLDVLRPAAVIDIGGLRADAFAPEDHGDWLRLSAFMTMSDAIASPLLARKMPMVIESLAQAASTQIRNMVSLGGNLLQRTRCGYYRDISWAACNRRTPGSGCAALSATAWAHAVLGTSGACIATYPGDLAQALVALDATLELEGASGPRLLSLAELHQLPGDTPHIETRLAGDEIIAAIRVPVRPWFARSRYVKVRDRASYEFALASAAVALDLDGDLVRDARIALGGVATVPWRAREAEAALRGQRLTEETASAISEAAFANAIVRPGTQARLDLGRTTLVRALLETARG